MKAEVAFQSHSGNVRASENVLLDCCLSSSKQCQSMMDFPKGHCRKPRATGGRVRIMHLVGHLGAAFHLRAVTWPSCCTQINGESRTLAHSEKAERQSRQSATVFSCPSQERQAGLGKGLGLRYCPSPCTVLEPHPKEGRGLWLYLWRAGLCSLDTWDPLWQWVREEKKIELAGRQEKWM